MYNALKILIDNKGDKPMVVLALGFLTEKTIDNFDRDWLPGLQRFCVERGYGLAYFYWDSKNLGSLLSTFQLNNRSGSEAALDTLVKAWNDARTNADLSVNMLHEMLKILNGKEIILLGHSLGARILLKLASEAPPKSFKKLIALAPACSVSDIDTQAILKSVMGRSTIVYSASDWVLNILYPLAQSPMDISSAFQSKVHALGALVKTTNTLLNPPIRALGACAHNTPLVELDATIFAQQMGHLDYYKYARKILTQLV